MLSRPAIPGAKVQLGEWADSNLTQRSPAAGSVESLSTRHSLLVTAFLIGEPPIRIGSNPCASNKNPNSNRLKTRLFRPPWQTAFSLPESACLGGGPHLGVLQLLSSYRFILKPKAPRKCMDCEVFTLCSLAADDLPLIMVLTFLRTPAVQSEYSLYKKRGVLANDPR